MILNLGMGLALKLFIDSEEILILEKLRKFNEMVEKIVINAASDIPVQKQFGELQ